MSLTHEDVQRILAILNEAECEEVKIEVGDLKLYLRKHGYSSDVRHGQPFPHTDDTQARSELDKEIAAPASSARRSNDVQPPPEGIAAVTSPMLGTFYRAPSPGEKPFVEEGEKVAANDTVCLVEVMKLFNSVKAGTSGTVEKILVENGTLVEYGQPLVWIRKETPL